MAVTPLEVSGFTVQLKQADKLGARFVVLLGDDELKQGKVIVKELAKGEQSTVAQNEISKFLLGKSGR